MTAKEELIRQVLDLEEAEAARARIVIDREQAEMMSLPFPLRSDLGDLADRHGAGVPARGPTYLNDTSRYTTGV